MKCKFSFLILSIVFASLGLKAQTPPDTSKLQEFVITATKTERNPDEVPARITVINSEQIEASVVQQVDDIIKYTPGINVNRSTGMYSQRPSVTLRGLSGDEQARTLVMLNGVPLNTSDEGGVNWNRFNQYDIERIEIFKGPGSSLYGNNAMGGVINIITKKPIKPQEIYSGISFGTFNTLRQDLNLRFSDKSGFYGVLSQYYLKSDGYNNVPDSDRTSYDTARYLESIGISARLGYSKSKWFNWEMQYDIYRDKRGEGYKIFAPEGAYRNFNTNLFRGQLKGSDDKTSYTLSAFYQMENYYDINEKMRNTTYSRYDVNSYREDMGAFLNGSRQLFANNILTGGFDYKVGSIQGGDFYQTAPYDTIYNEGKLTTLAGFLQEEQSLLNNKLRIIAGLRFDQVTFSDGYHYNTDPWNVMPVLTDNTWTELSPRLGLRVNILENLSGYLSYSHGFRASILDDLIRTGWMWVGPKYANPLLKPESMNNYEVGFDYKPIKKLKISVSAYTTRGDDFLYYVATSDSLFGRSIYRRENVTNVQVDAVETEFTYALHNNLKLMGGYTFCESRIVGFDERPELENKYLKYVPKHNASLSLFWQNKYLNLSTRAIYKGEQFADDANQIVMDDYFSVDVSLSKTLAEKYIISLDIQNVMDDKHMENVYYISPGRLITGKVAIKL